MDFEQRPATAASGQQRATIPPVRLPPGFQSPSTSDADSTLAGFRAVDCPLRRRVDDAFSCDGGSTNIPDDQAQVILSFVQTLLRDKNCFIHFDEFEKLLASKRESAPGPDGLPNSVYRCAGCIGAKFVFAACQTWESRQTGKTTGVSF